MEKVKTKRAGLNLIEIAIVLAVIGLVIGGIYVAANSVYSNMKRQKAQQQVLQIVQGIRAALNASGSSTGLSNAVAIQLGAVPQDMFTGTTITTPWGGAVTIASPAAASFTVNYAAVPYDSCADFVYKVFQSPAAANQAGLINVNINGTAVTTANLDLANVTANCPGSGSSAIVFAFNTRN